MNYLFSSEAVSIGHPDKMCDQISDAILDAYLSKDPDSKVAVECLITSGKLLIAGEVTSNATIDAVSIARETIRKIGYTHESIGFDCDRAEYENRIHAQSHEINYSVSDGGAGDQGLMFGYATNETPNLLPLPILSAQNLMIKQQELRSQVDWLLPDAKSQVTFYYENHVPRFIEKIVLSTQHTHDIPQEELRDYVKKYIIEPVVGEFVNPKKQPDILINPSGSFLYGGPHSDTGLTGRKIIVDTYGGSAPHGGGAFSGKDPSKVDRSAAYAARFVAKQIVYAKLAERCTVQLSYAIGVKEPCSVYIHTHGTGIISDELITTRVLNVFDLTPNGIIGKLKLKQPIYLQTARNGHFTHSEFPWEKRDEESVRNLSA